MSQPLETIQNSARDLATQAQSLADAAARLANQTSMTVIDHHGADLPFFVTGLTVFVLACFVGYHVVWRVTPALHSPLMGITNAISSVIIVGAILAAGLMQAGGFSMVLAFFAIILASVNIFGGFMITHRMLQMFKKKG